MIICILNFISFILERKFLSELNTLKWLFNRNHLCLSFNIKIFILKTSLLFWPHLTPLTQFTGNFSLNLSHVKVMNMSFSSIQMKITVWQALDMVHIYSSEWLISWTNATVAIFNLLQAIVMQIYSFIHHSRLNAFVLSYNVT